MVESYEKQILCDLRVCQGLLLHIRSLERGVNSLLTTLDPQASDVFEFDSITSEGIFLKLVRSSTGMVVRDRINAERIQTLEGVQQFLSTLERHLLPTFNRSYYT